MFSRNIADYPVPPRLTHQKLNMWFSLKTDLPFLFEEWSLSTVSGLVLALVAAVALAVLYESLNFYVHLRQSSLRNDTGRYTFRNNIRAHCLLTVLHLLRLLLGYMLMLCVMTFNVWLLVAIAVGSGFSYLCLRPVINTCFFRGKNNYGVTDEVRTNLLSTQDNSRQDYLTYGTYFNTSDPWSESTERQNSFREPELTMYISVI